MTTIEKSVDVAVGVRTAYNQWTQFESFPRFMAGVDEIRQLSPTKIHWRTSIAGVRREFDAEITEQHPDERVAWRTMDGPHHGGVVSFHRLDDEHTRVMLQMEYLPGSLTEKAGAALGIVERQIGADLERFKEFIESRGKEIGEWHGDIPRSPQRGETTPFHEPTRPEEAVSSSGTGSIPPPPGAAEKQSPPAMPPAAGGGQWGPADRVARADSGDH
jgi:ribosome-associated toxin RatA of RatAB toxin-antitoxin module